MRLLLSSLALVVLAGCSSSNTISDTDNHPSDMHCAEGHTSGWYDPPQFVCDKYIPNK